MAELLREQRAINRPNQDSECDDHSEHQKENLSKHRRKGKNNRGDSRKTMEDKNQDIKQGQRPMSKREPLTHFLCLPLATPISRVALEASVDQFHKLVLDTQCTLHRQSTGTSTDSVKRSEHAREHQEANSLPDRNRQRESVQRAIYDENFWTNTIRPVGTLHFTLGVMSLRGKERIQEAVEFLKCLDLQALVDGPAASSTANNEDVAGTGMAQGDEKISVRLSSPAMKLSLPSQSNIDTSCSDMSTSNLFEISLTSLHPMQNPKSTSVLYTDVSAGSISSHNLYDFCNRLRNIFIEKGFIISENRPLKLHVTVLNTVYAMGRKQRTGKSESQGTVPKHKDGVVLEPSYLESMHNDTPAVQRANFAESSAAQPYNDAVGSAPEESSEAHRLQDETMSKADRRKPRGRSRPLKFDATALIERCKEFVWIDNLHLEKVSICEMGAKKAQDANDSHPRTNLGDTPNDWRIPEAAYKEVFTRLLPSARKI